MFFSRRRRRASGLSLTSLIVIGGALYGTGAGAWLTDRISQLPAACYSGLSGQQSVCANVDRIAGSTVNIATRTGAFLDNITGGLRGMQAGSAPSINLSGTTASPLRLPQWGQLDLSRMNVQQFHSESIKRALAPYLQAAQFSNPASVNFSPERALGLHQQSASMGAYGLGSQLALGNAYAQGVGTAANPAQAKQYYQQALDSLNQLEGMSNADAHGYLQSFGAPTTTMRAELEKQIQLLGR